MNRLLFDEAKYIKPEEDSWDNFLFELTDYCNLNCPFCLNSSSTGNSGFMTFENFKLMYSKIQNKVGLLQLSGGEPLTKPDIKKK